MAIRTWVLTHRTGRWRLAGGSTVSLTSRCTSDLHSYSQGRNGDICTALKCLCEYINNHPISQGTRTVQLIVMGNASIHYYPYWISFLCFPYDSSIDILRVYHTSSECAHVLIVVRISVKDSPKLKVSPHLVKLPQHVFQLLTGGIGCC